MLLLIFTSADGATDPTTVQFFKEYKTICSNKFQLVKKHIEFDNVQLSTPTFDPDFHEAESLK